MMEQMEFSADFFNALYLSEKLYFVKNENAALPNLGEAVLVINEPDTPENVPSPAVENEPLPKVESPATKIESQAQPINIPLLILVDVITEAEKVFLEKILNAVKLSLDKVELITLNDLKAKSFKERAEGKTYFRILSFGVPLTHIHLSILLLPYQPQQLENMWCLMAEKLVVVEADVAHKRSLWESLQKIF
jgi:hypothetical protein